ncbi:zinc protease [Chondromyces apiculatus DSM 436]|uniref:Zinc protease n=1 Tax=Chondromyces apiculatus DSM 436 TaxID=1192034 RepID=A0A017SY90_9BACT|nr:zinc protease [Chondromyces apiculatus DSM 436]
MPLRWKTNLALFLLTVVTVFFAGAGWAGVAPTRPGLLGVIDILPSGWRFAVPLLAILLVHEFGHYFAARVHGVAASLPYFIPLPGVGLLGTMGAVISMPERIKSRNALLDIGAAGPLAGLAVAIPVLVIGLLQSRVEPVSGSGILEGQSLFYMGLKRLLLGPIPEGHDVFLSPTALAGWAGLLITMINLLPVGQLDGGHIAYALLGPVQNRVARVIHPLLLVIVAYNLARFLPGAIAAGTGDAIWQAIGNSSFWFAWFVLVLVLQRVGGTDHPPTDPGEISAPRRLVAIVSLVIFVLLFMPTPVSTY